MSKNILVVEDEVVVAKDIQKRLEHLGYTVTARVQTGQQAIEQAEQDHPDLVLMDIRLKGEMDGIESADQIRTQFDIPVIYLTAHEDEDTLQRAKVTGPFGYLTKPLDEVELYAAIEVALYRHQMEMELRQREATLRSLLESSPNAITMTDLEGTIVECNQMTLKVHGCASKDEIIGRNAIEFTAPKDHKRVADDIQKTLEQGSVKNIEYTLLRKDGQPFFGELSASVLTDASGNPSGFVAVTRDITERKRIERGLIRARNEWERTFHAVPDLITLLDKDYRIIRVNKAMADRLGLTPEECIGRYCYMIAHETPEPPVFCPHTRLLEDGQEHREEIYEEHLGGHFIVTASPLFDDEGRLFGSVHVARDITDRRQMEDDLRNAKESADTANRAKSAFLAHMSHELRTPLNGILGYTQILKQDQDLTDSQAHAIETIHYSGEHLLMLINDVLDLAKIESGKLELEPDRFFLCELVHDIGEMIRIRAEQKGLVFVREEDPGLPKMIDGDEKRLRQVLLNLLGNAVKFTKQGKVTLRVKKLDTGYSILDTSGQHPGDQRPATSIQHPASSIQFEVEDTGIGIPPDKLKEIFDPFKQVRDQQFKQEGTGLGLTISRQLVEKMGSRLHVESTPGKGSVFWFELKLSGGEEAITPVLTESEESEAKSSRRIVGFNGERRKVLIVDDNKSNRMVLRYMLGPLGFEIAEAASGQEGLDTTRDFRPDLILMDLVMPEMDGWESTQQIRQIPELKDVIVIGVSASAFGQTREEALAASCDDFLTKPIDRNVLLKMVEGYLNVEWIYADERNERHLDEETIIPPPPEELAQLYDLAMIGDIMEIRKRIEALAALDPQFTPFVVKFRQLAKDLKLTCIQECLQEYLEKNNRGGREE